MLLITLIALTACGEGDNIQPSCYIEGNTIHCPNGGSLEVPEEGPPGKDGEPCSVSVQDDHLVINCANSSEGIDLGESCEQDPSTNVILYSWDEARQTYSTCMSEAQFGFLQCQINGGAYGECVAQRDTEEANCFHWHAMRVNKMPIRECGAQIWVDVGNCPDQPDPACSVWQVDSVTDTDGDGITDWMEHWMGYNLCTPFSTGCEADADDDYDADGIPNGEDEQPVCNWEDPANWQTDCV